MPSESDLLEGLNNASQGPDDGSLTPETPAPVSGENGSQQETVAPSTSNDDFLTADSVYADLPDAFRTGKTLDKLIADVNARHSKALSDATAKYQGYEPFTQVPVEELAYAYQIFQMMDTKDGAQKVFDALVNTYGFSNAQAAQQVQQMQQAAEQNQEPEEELSPEQQKIKELESQIQDLNNYRSQQQQNFNRAVAQEEERLFGEELDKSLQKIYAFDPTLAQDQVRNDDLLARIVYAVDNNIKTGGKLSVDQIAQKAFNEHRQYNQYLYDKLSSQRQTNPVPIVMAPTGSNPGGNHSFDPKDENARDAEMVRRLQELANL